MRAFVIAPIVSMIAVAAVVGLGSGTRL